MFNLVILGGGDPLLSNSVGNSIDEQLQMLEKYKHNLEMAKQMKVQQLVQATLPAKLIWDEIDSEIQPMTDELKNLLLLNEDYLETYNGLQMMVLNEILNLVKGRIEGTQEGKDLLTRQLKTVKRLKTQIIDKTNREMEMFKKFREYSKTNPEATYDEFIKASM